MLRKVSVIFISLLLILSACENSEPKIPQEEAELSVIERHSGDIAEVKIKSVSHKWGKYIVEWENDGNCENGIDHIDDRNGELIKGEVTSC